MKILGIESSCDETAAAVVEDGRNVLSNIIASSLEEHKLYGGVVPEIASRRHAESISGVVREALASDVKPPFLCLIVSGGHSHIVAVNTYTEFEIIGKTRDDAAGEALDKAGRTMGLEYPGGVSIDRLSPQGDENMFKFPKPKVSGSPYDFSFSGLKTAVINTVHHAQQKGEEINTADLAASFQKAVVDCLISNLEKAAREKNYNKIVIAGGVSANSKLRREAQKLCERHKWTLYLPELKYCGDNAAMIASQGYYELISGVTAGENLNAYATMSIDKNYKTV